jgi:hypothetical protein
MGLMSVRGDTERIVWKTRVYSASSVSPAGSVPAGPSNQTRLTGP